MIRKWFPDEDETLVTHYESRGSLWSGWHMLLPGRSPQDIRNRAKALSINERSMLMGREVDVLSLMNIGMAPSRIDAELGCEPGTARKVVTGRWSKLDFGMEGF